MMKNREFISPELGKKILTYYIVHFLTFHIPSL